MNYFDNNITFEERKKLILENFFDVNTEEMVNGLVFTPLINAISNKNIEEVKFLLQRGADVNKITETWFVDSEEESGFKVLTSPLSRACEENDKELVTLLLDSGAKIDYTSFSAAVYDSDLVDILIERGGDVNCFDEYNNLINVAVERGNLKSVKKLVEAGAKINPVGCSVSAIETSQVYHKDDIKKYLLSKGANPISKSRLRVLNDMSMLLRID